MGEGVLLDKARRIYRDIPIDPSSLDVYVRLMELQDALQRELAGKYSSVNLEAVNASLQEGKPAFLSVDLGLEESELGRILERITGLLKSELADAAESIARLEQAWRNGELSLVELGNNLLMGDIEFAHKKAEEIGVDHEILEAVSAWVMQVVFRALASQLGDKLDLSSWSSGRCPVCGGSTRLEFVDSDGTAHLKCQFCGEEWTYPAGKCPFCGNEKAELITSVSPGGDERFSLNVCHVCGMYWKVVDERIVGQGTPRELYDLWTFKLDLLAAGKNNWR